MIVNMDSMSYPTVQLFARETCCVIHDEEERERKRNAMVTYAREKLLPGYTYFMTHFWETNAKRYSNLQMYKLYRILNPKFVKSMGNRFTTAYVESELHPLLNVNGIHGISEIQLQNIISKVAEYKVLCSNEDFEDVDYKDTLIRILEFWDIHHNELSAWWVLVERAYLFQPSSCAHL